MITDYYESYESYDDFCNATHEVLSKVNEDFDIDSYMESIIKDSIRKDELKLRKLLLYCVNRIIYYYDSVIHIVPETIRNRL